MGQSTSLVFGMTALIGLGILFPLTPFAAAKETTAPGQFELLFPANNAVTYATTYGDTPLLAWQESSGSASGIDHYEVWMDGANVDNIPAGLYGHLPGEKVGNYEPFRPFGFLAAEKVYYYTPLVSTLSAGSHQWHVKAVDKDGNKRRSNSMFNFKVEDFSPAKVFVNHLGFLSNANKRVVVDSGVNASSFEVLDLAGQVVFSGDLKSGGGAFGNNLVGDFTGSGVSGTYRIKARSAYSMWFPIGLEARLNYESYLRKYRNAYTRKRCGETTVNWGGKACHLEDARMDGGKRHGITGGWHASSDVRKIMRILQPGLYGLIEMKRIINPAWDRGDDSILDEIKWGNKYIHQMQLDSGAVVQHYYLWCGAKDWGESINRYTNNIIGDSDDRVLEENTLLIDMVSQSRFIKNQTSIYRLYKDTDPAYAKKCLKAAERCYNYFVKTWPVVTEYETTFNARPYMETVTDLMPLAYGIRANLYMYLATDNSVYKDQAVDLADKFMALQETEYIAGQKEVKGFFYRDAKKDKIFSSLMAHGGMDGAEGGVIVLADLCDALPAHSKCPQWKESLRSYLQDYLLVLSDKNAFGIVPAYLSRTPLAGGQTGAKMQRHVGGLYYQYLCDNRGANKVLARKALLLARGGRILGNPIFRDAAWRQVDWILGNNPLDRSTVYGVGHNQPKLYKAQLAPRSDGMVVQGIGGGAKDMPYMRQGHWRWCEMELHNTAWFAQAVFELLTPANPRVGGSCPRVLFTRDIQ
ncbi:MAG: glycoside hydrolase family 9 protein [Phycisphaerae bacterium]|nr:glycoside hydrolase family 9 protein [Phycisphaerae bacterium]